MVVGTNEFEFSVSIYRSIVGVKTMSFSGLSLFENYSKSSGIAYRSIRRVKAKKILGDN